MVIFGYRRSYNTLGLADKLSKPFNARYLFCLRSRMCYMTDDIQNQQSMLKQTSL